MGQVTLDLDDDTLARMRAAAVASGLSMSAWLAQLVGERTLQAWPVEVAALAGAWHDLPSAEELRAGLGVDVPREDVEGW